MGTSFLGEIGRNSAELGGLGTLRLGVLVAALVRRRVFGLLQRRPFLVVRSRARVALQGAAQTEHSASERDEDDQLGVHVE